jgi:hypothetical protein
MSVYRSGTRPNDVEVLVAAVSVSFRIRDGAVQGRAPACFHRVKRL